MTNSKAKNSILYSFIGVLLVLLLWGFFYLVVRNSYIVPSPLTVIKESLLLLINGEFYAHLLSTLFRVLLALFISIILGVTLAIFSSLFKTVESVMLPLFSIIRSLPVLAVLLIILVFVPRGIAPVVVCVLSILPITYSQTLNYLNGIDFKQKEMLNIYNVSKKKRVFSVYLKGYAPLFIKETASQFSFSLKLIVSAEILAQVYKSIGGDVNDASIYSNVTKMFALTLIICVLGVVVEVIGNHVFNKMEKKYK